MAKFKYFELDEFIKSRTAIEKGIDNTPTFEVVDHLSELVSEILDPLRAAYGKPIYVSSGFRCLALNSILKGASTTSVHPIGYAADLYADDMEDFKAFVKEWLIKTRTRFDQCILERSGKDEWVHIGLYNRRGQQRGQIKLMNV